MAVQVLIESRTGTHICERCTDVCKQIADSKAGGTSGVHVTRKLPTEVASDTIALLRQIRDEQVLTDEDYKARSGFLLIRESARRDHHTVHKLSDQPSIYLFQRSQGAMRVERLLKRCSMITSTRSAIVFLLLFSPIFAAATNNPTEKELMPLLEKYVTSGASADPGCHFFGGMDDLLPDGATLKQVEIKILEIHGPVTQMYGNNLTNYTVWPVRLHLAIRYLDPELRTEVAKQGEHIFYAMRDRHDQSRWVVFHCQPPTSS